MATKRNAGKANKVPAKNIKTEKLKNLSEEFENTQSNVSKRKRKKKTSIQDNQL